ncbi:2'-hydroxyisoflavone reductase [Aliiroseovarius halocynthiae]|uniref:NAD-dependent epimerase/dehydratase family protein n=1 Tax=Aliiroseovarius halocynthiae TaxID=985055 RepID=A0A545SL15_9RHOB|nr:NAD-dependent epimerase/dehydratase family protein [Aliiroseovarius halocynthiae]TQV65673.1 NAD-dependent epimerase/dehydratase family protein [Aliiroseovarius halocynthiae]SMR84068.1 2'-hydroxyisoflavone reductase [Aliiroseovarius halocynthiae]
MRCLVVGGTGFLGGVIVDALLEEGHSVSILSRGETKRQTGAATTTLAADRHQSLDILKNHNFDWVFDTCGYAPNAVTHLLSAIGDGISRYVLISSISAYGSFSKPNLDETENVPTATADDLALAASLPHGRRSSAAAYGASYGALKRACEIEAERMLGDRATSLRVGLLVGAGDYSDRLTWWVRRIDGARGTFPAPAPQNRPVQFIDVRDVADFALRCAIAENGGIWNVTGECITFAEVIEGITYATGSAATPVWIDEQVITDSGLAPWVDIPLMAPSVAEFRYFLNVSTAKARSAGLSCRPPAETLTPLVDWDRIRRNVPLKCGMSAEQEALLLERRDS